MFFVSMFPEPITAEPSTVFNSVSPITPALSINILPVTPPVIGVTPTSISLDKSVVLEKLDPSGKKIVGVYKPLSLACTSSPITTAFFTLSSTLTFFPRTSKLDKAGKLFNCPATFFTISLTGFKIALPPPATNGILVRVLIFAKSSTLINSHFVNLLVPLGSKSIILLMFQYWFNTNILSFNLIFLISKAFK